MTRKSSSHDFNRGNANHEIIRVAHEFIRGDTNDEVARPIHEFIRWNMEMNNGWNVAHDFNLGKEDRGIAITNRTVVSWPYPDHSMIEFDPTNEFVGYRMCSSHYIPMNEFMGCGYVSDTISFTASYPHTVHPTNEFVGYGMCSFHYTPMNEFMGWDGHMMLTCRTNEFVQYRIRCQYNSAIYDFNRGYFGVNNERVVTHEFIRGMMNRNTTHATHNLSQSIGNFNRGIKEEK